MAVPRISRFSGIEIELVLDNINTQRKYLDILIQLSGIARAMAMANLHVLDSLDGSRCIIYTDTLLEACNHNALSFTKIDYVRLMCRTCSHASPDHLTFTHHLFNHHRRPGRIDRRLKVRSLSSLLIDPGIPRCVCLTASRSLLVSDRLTLIGLPTP